MRSAKAAPGSRCFAAQGPDRGFRILEAGAATVRESCQQPVECLRPQFHVTLPLAQVQVASSFLGGQKSLVKALLRCGPCAKTPCRSVADLATVNFRLEVYVVFQVLLF